MVHECKTKQKRNCLPVCECQQNYETVQHKIFECEMCDRESREEMLSELKKSGLSHAKDIRDILAISLKKRI